MRKLTKIIAIAAFAFSSISAIAEQTDDEFCAMEAKIAESIMKSRQAGVPIGKILAVQGSDSYRNLIIDAYELPRMSYEPNKQRMIDDFRDDHHVACLKAMSNKKPARKLSGS